MKLQFERGSIDACPRIITSDWVQLTYCTIRDDHDTDIAIYDGNFWILNDGSKWSDVIISED